MAEDLRKKLHLINLSGRLEEMIKFRVPTGILAIDRVLGGGIPSGRLTELYGDFSTGKSRLAYHILAQAQQQNGIAVLVDTERAFSEGLASLTELDTANLIYPDPNEIITIEDVFKCLETCISVFREPPSDQLVVLIWDSVAATPGMEDLENELGANTAAMRRAKVISDGLKKLMHDVYKHNIALIFINQIREKMGVMYGEKVETVGGKALKFTASLRVHVHLDGKIKNEKTQELDGYKGRLEVEKSRVSRPFGVVNFEMLTEKPIDKYSGLLDYLVRHGEIEGKAGWFNFPGEEKKFRADDFPAVYEEHLKEKK